MRVLIVDDHPIVANGLAATIKSAYAFVEILKAGNGQEAINHLKAGEIDLMLTDLQMPDTDSLSLIEQALALHPQIRLLVVSAKPERLFAVRYLNAGAHGYWEKGSDTRTLLKAVQLILAGKQYVGPGAADMMRQEASRRSSVSSPFEKLTSREFEVVNHLVNGLRPTQICNLLNIQPSTMTTFRQRIFDKIGVTNVHELSLVAKEYHLTS